MMNVVLVPPAGMVVEVGTNAQPPIELKRITVLERDGDPKRVMLQNVIAPALTVGCCNARRIWVGDTVNGAEMDPLTVVAVTFPATMLDTLFAVSRTVAPSSPAGIVIGLGNETELSGSLNKTLMPPVGAGPVSDTLA